MESGSRDEQGTSRPSKSERKREMTALQKIGVELVALNTEQLRQFELPEQLLEAVLEAQRITDFEGRRRQMQYIGKLMRNVDPEPIRMQLSRWHGKAREHTALQHQAERWRARLLDEVDGVALFAAQYPRSDVQRLRTLLASIKRDQEAQRPLKNYRELFRLVRETIGRAAGPVETPDD